MWIHYVDLEVKEKEYELSLCSLAQTSRPAGIPSLSSFSKGFELFLSEVFSPAPKAGWFSSSHLAGMNGSCAHK